MHACCRPDASLRSARAASGQQEINVVARLKRGAHSRTTISRVRLGDAPTSPRVHRDASLHPSPLVLCVVDGIAPAVLPFPSSRFHSARSSSAHVSFATYRSNDIPDIILGRPHQMQIVVLDGIVSFN